jgi:hypothetical protein
MKIRLTPRARPHGYALILVLLIIAVSTIYFAATCTRTYTEAHLNDRNTQFMITENAAEAATELAVARMRYDYITSGFGTVTNNLAIYRTNIPAVADNTFWRKFQFSDGQGHANQMYVSCISNTAWGQAQAAFPGLYGYFSIYRVLCNATMTNTSYHITNAVQQDLALNAIPIFQFAIFYNSLMEYTWCATFTINGRVHANGSIYTGSSSQLTFNGNVTTTTSISSPANDGHSPPYTYNGTFNGGLATNGYILLPLGTNNVHNIVQEPPTGESPSSVLGSSRLYNLANVVLLVSNSTVTLRVQSSQNGLVPGADGSSNLLVVTNLSAASLSTNLPFLSVSNSFSDQRESKTAYVTQIDVGKYASWVSTNSRVLAKYPTGGGAYPSVLYVADNRTSNNASQFTAVRLNNAANVPFAGASGFTVATQNPLYVWGNFNCTNSSYLGTTNTSSSAACALMSDALTILSPAWQDSQSSLGITSGSKAKATTDTVDSAIIAGIVYSTGTGTGAFSGGVMNLPRLLEDWSSTTLTMNTSIVNLYASTVATNQFKDPGNYYYAPATRNFSFDLNFQNPARTPPPATPNLLVLTRYSWAQAPANTVNYTVH